MNKTVKYALVGSGIGFFLKALLNGIEQYKEMQEDPNKDFDLGSLLSDGAMGALIGGGTGAIVGAVADHQNEKIEPKDTDAFFSLLATNLVRDPKSSQFKKEEKLCDDLMSFLDNKLSHELSNVPFIWGSTAKGTAIKGKSDWDIMVQYKSTRKTHDSIKEELYSILLEYPHKDFIRIRNQTRSIGLFFEINGEEISIDIVPQKETNDNTRDTSTSLYVDPPGLFSTPTFTKTDLGKQASRKFTPTQQKMVVILKAWKKDNGVPFSSYLLESYVFEYYKRNRGRIPRNFTNKFVDFLYYIHNTIDTIRIVDIGNSNNVLTDIPNDDKSKVKRAIGKVLDRYEYQPNSLIDTFGIELS